MARLPINPERDALVDVCDDAECECCDLGEHLLQALNDTRVSTANELLTLVRVLAATIVASSLPDGRTLMLDMVIGQLRGDVDTLASSQPPAEIH